MTDPRLYKQDAFVLLEAGKPEEILMPDELRKRLAELIAAYPDDVPADVGSLNDSTEQVQYLVDSYCELTVGTERFFQWYAIRLEK